MVATTSPAHDPEASAFARLAREPRLHEVLRALLAIPAPRLALGWPHDLVARRAEPGCTAFELRTAVGAGPVFLCLPWAVLAALAERLLGGPGRIDSLVPNAPPLPAEVGCVGYLLARLLATAGSPWQLADAHSHAERVLASAGDDWLMWPMALHSELGVLSFTLAAPPASLPTDPLPLRLALSDEGPLAAADVAEGALVLCDDPGLSLLVDGLSGTVVARVPAFDAEALVELDRGRARVCSLRAPRNPRAELVLASRALSPAALCALAAGRLAWVVDGGDACELRLDGVPVARGELVRLRGALGMRITGR